MFTLTACVLLRSFTLSFESWTPKPPILSPTCGVVTLTIHVTFQMHVLSRKRYESEDNWSIRGPMVL